MKTPILLSLILLIVGYARTCYAGNNDNRKAITFKKVKATLTTSKQIESIELINRSSVEINGAINTNRQYPKNEQSF